ncbi:MAG: hypothetical protein ACLFO2_04490 [Candidatus Woesearchaeota archaeon]
MDGRQREAARAHLRKLTGKPHIAFTAKGNHAIKKALSLARKKREELLIPDQAGWLTYKPLGEKASYTIRTLKTDAGLITPDMTTGDDKTVLLINTLPAYAFTIPAKAIAEKCKEQGILLINDTAASIGTPAAKEGDIIIGSFGKWKPIPLRQGGFIATDHPLDEDEPSLDWERLTRLLETIKRRTTAMKHRANKLKQHLRRYDLIHPDKAGYNVIARYATEQEKENLINDAEALEPRLEHTLCPRDIRVNQQAVCFELKRMFDDEV